MTSAGRVVPATSENVRHAVELLRHGELVCFPTETVYGVGADAADPSAVRAVFQAKGRPADHPLIVHLPDAEALAAWVESVPPEAERLAERFWPGPLTLVLRRGQRVPAVVTGGQETVAVRVPAHPVARELLSEFGGALAAPSANRFGRISPTRAEDAAAELGTAVALILDGGPCRVGLESTIVDLSGPRPRLLRPGGISREAVAAVLGVVPESPGEGRGPRAPGRLPSHYAPTSPVVLLSAPELAARVRADTEAAALTHTVDVDELGPRGRRLPAEPEGYARGLYAALRDLDRFALPILVESPPTVPAWEAVADRLTRAAAGSEPAAEAPGTEPEGS